MVIFLIRKLSRILHERTCITYVQIRVNTRKSLNISARELSRFTNAPVFTVGICQTFFCEYSSNNKHITEMQFFGISRILFAESSGDIMWGFEKESTEDKQVLFASTHNRNMCAMQYSLILFYLCRRIKLSNTFSASNNHQNYCTAAAVLH